MENAQGRVGKKGPGLMLVVTLIMICFLAARGWADDTRMVTVKRGDTIGSLCREVYHAYSGEIAALLKGANPELTNLNQIRVGQTLRFPALSGAAASTPTPAAAATPAPAAPSAPPVTMKDSREPSPEPHPASSQPPAPGDRLARVFFHETTPVSSLLPDGTTTAPGFEPAAAATPIGAVEQAQGQAWIIHQGTNLAYTAARDQPLFSGDTLITDTRAELRCRLDDKSVFTMAGHSKLVLDKSVYDPSQDRRESVLQLLFGRVRFMVNHLRGSYANDYQVHTPTAICGVRGSDFVVAVLPTTANTARIDRWPSFLRELCELFSVRSAHAALGLSMTTTLLAGPNTQVGFSGLIGPSQLVSAGTLSTAVTGGAALGPIGVSGAVMGGALNSVGSLSAVMAMPPGWE